MKFDVAIIGGGPAGIQAAVSARNSYSSKSVALIRENDISLIPCGIPYVISRLKSVDDDIMPDSILKNKQVELIIGTVMSHEGKELIMEDSRRIGYDRLVLATGSHAFTPEIPGFDKSGIFTVDKTYDRLVDFRTAAKKAERVLIIGGGYIGVELADELLLSGKLVTLVEMLPNLLGTSIDPEFSQLIHKELKDRGCQIITGKPIVSFSGGESVTGADVADGEHIDADFVAVAAGYRPNLSLAESFDVKVDNKYGIVVDEYMRTSVKDIFAVGDCAAARNCFTGELSNVKLASAAMVQGRLAGSNLFKITLVRHFPGTLGTFTTKVGDVALGVTGLTEEQAKIMNVDYFVGTSEAINRHPGMLPGGSKTIVKLIFARQFHILLGAQVVGGDSVGELTNLLAVMIQNKMTDMEIDTLQIGTHPLLTASPLAYPIITATVNSILKWYE